MGRKGKRHRSSLVAPFCYYCDRGFDDEFTLVQHQKARHFSCYICKRKFQFASSMAQHVSSVHKEAVGKVPNAKAGQDAIAFDIHGMAGVPDDAIVARMTQAPVKKPKFDNPVEVHVPKPKAKMWYPDPLVSPEEKRACLAQYQVSVE